MIRSANGSHSGSVQESILASDSVDLNTVPEESPTSRLSALWTTDLPSHNWQRSYPITSLVHSRGTPGLWWCKHPKP